MEKLRKLPTNFRGGGKRNTGILNWCELPDWLDVSPLCEGGDFQI